MRSIKMHTLMSLAIPAFILAISYRIYAANARPNTLQVTQGCPELFEFRPNSNSCYYWEHNNFETFASAQQECNLRNADLLVINNPDEQNWVNAESAKVSKYPTDGWYIGLQKPDSGGWAWISDHSYVAQKVNWNQEPDNFNNQDCCATNQYFRFSDEDCNAKYGYICKYTAPQGSACPIDSNSVKHWFSTSNTCYYISDPLDDSDRYTWLGAQQRCKSLNAAAQLLPVKSFLDVAFVTTKLPANNPNVRLPWWTGMNDRTYEGKYVWQDGTPVNDTLITWDQAPSTDASQKQNCAIMYSGGVVDDANCATKAYYVCEKSSNQAISNYGCGPWTRAGNKCYLFGSGAVYTRNDARNKCLKAGGDLLKIDNKDEMNWIYHMEIGGGDYWTGLTDAAKEGTWLWADGTPADTSNYVKWNREPNNYASNEDCGLIGHDGVYNDMGCDAQEGYICEYKRVSGHIIITASCPTGWVSHGDSCYFFSNISGSDVLRWSDVQKKCNDLVQDQGITASYIAVDSQDEKKWLETQLSQMPNGYRGWWTGLNDRNVEGVWIFYGEEDGVPDPSLIPWNGEPNNAGGNENCAIMYQGGRFNDLPCSAKAHYICEKPVAGQQQTSGSSRKGGSYLIFVLGLCFAMLTIR